MILQLLVVITASPSVSCHKASLYLVDNWVMSFKVSAFAGGIVRIKEKMLQFPSSLVHHPRTCIDVRAICHSHIQFAHNQITLVGYIAV